MHICRKTYNYKLSSIHAYRKDKSNLYGIVDKPSLITKMDKTEFIKWNELPSNDRCMDIAAKKYSDKEVIEKLLQYFGGMASLGGGGGFSGGGSGGGTR